MNFFDRIEDLVDEIAADSQGETAASHTRLARPTAPPPAAAVPPIPLPAAPPPLQHSMSRGRSNSPVVTTASLSSPVAASTPKIPKPKRRKRDSPVPADMRCCVHFVRTAELSRGEIEVLTDALRVAFSGPGRVADDEEADDEIPTHTSGSSSCGQDDQFEVAMGPDDPDLTHIVTRLTRFEDVVAAIETVPPPHVFIVDPSWVSACRKAKRILLRPPPRLCVARSPVDLEEILKGKSSQRAQKRKVRSKKRRRMYDLADSQLQQQQQQQANDGSQPPPRKRTRRFGGGWGPVPGRGGMSMRGGKRVIATDRKQFFACQRDAHVSSANDHICEKLTELMELYEQTGEQWRAFAYRKSIQILRSLSTRIESVEDLQHVRGVGERIRSKIDELLTSGRISKLDNLRSQPRVQFIVAAKKIHGVGVKTAQMWWSRGLRTLEDIQDQSETLLNGIQQIGLRYYDDFQKKIPRDEIHPTAIVECCGSYRRGKAESGDVDVLISDTRVGYRPVGLLRRLVETLKRRGFLLETLGLSETSHLADTDDEHSDTYTGVCRIDTLARRLDLKVWVREAWAFAILYFTGDDHFNRSMRLWARKKGYSLSDHGIVEAVRDKKQQKIADVGRSVPCKTEREIFQLLGLDYKEPTERNTKK